MSSTADRYIRPAVAVYNLDCLPELAAACNGRQINCVRADTLQELQIISGRVDTLVLLVRPQSSTQFDEPLEILLRNNTQEKQRFSIVVFDAAQNPEMALRYMDYADSLIAPNLPTELTASFLTAAVRRQSFNKIRAEKIKAAHNWTKQAETSIGAATIRPADLTLTGASGEPVILSPKQLGILLFLVQRKGHVTTRKEIYERVWGTLQALPSRSLDQYIKSLKRIIAKTNSDFAIKCVRGVGYKIP